MIETRNKFRLSARHLVRTVATSALSLSAVAVGLMASSSSVSAQVAPPFGSSVSGQNKNIFYFTPWGKQLDDDDTPNDLHVPNTDLSANQQVINHNIYDIEIGSNTPLNFDLFLYTVAPQYSLVPKQLNSFKFLTHIDPLEYQLGLSSFASFSFNPAFVNACPVLPPAGDVEDGELVCNFKSPLNVTNNANFANEILLGTFHGKTIVPGLSAHDGVRDFKLDLSSLTYSDATKVAMVNGQFQDVEVQQTPAPLSLLGVGAAFGFSRNLRKRIKGSKSPEVMSALG
jgi:hypothetical protein